jgi:hypothetical protein
MRLRVGCSNSRGSGDIHDVGLSARWIRYVREDAAAQLRDAITATVESLRDSSKRLYIVGANLEFPYNAPSA